ncbi:hypothetical protein C8F04DRAFT_1064981 [Mycena alexandri]|uniref:Minichromosome loss protein Mcl1 middle region domain-containing protein n=1 Tax=Mycena alexandri TaxID=1745969 RepID=A0AAD6TG12_9AGAR|nr:hypothetical protein C8F04DRAFT_1064981 [Mycena alexandri]
MDSETELVVNAPHNPGNTCFAFSRDGLRAFTGGDEGVVRIWEVEKGSAQEPRTAVDANQAITSLATSHDCWASGSLDSDVRRYPMDSAEMDGLITNARLAAVRCVAIDPRGKFVAVTSDEEGIRVVDMEDTGNIKMLEKTEDRGHRGGVRKASWHPTEPLLTTCGYDGQLIAWDISQDKPLLEAMQGAIPTIKPGSTSPDLLHDCSAVWHPSGEYFFVVDRNRCIAKMRRSDWKKEKTLIDTANPTTTTTALAVSPNGAYLASASPSVVNIWSTETMRIVVRHSYVGVVTQLAFSPTQNLLAWTTTDGKFVRWPEPIPDTLPDPVKPLPKAASAAEDADEAMLAQMFGDDDLPSDLDQDMEDAGANAADADDASVASIDDWVDDADIPTGSNFVKEMVSITKAQPPFQPGATPESPSETKRLLASNRLGYIEATTVPGKDHVLIDLKFFDKSNKKNISFTSDTKYTVGALGDRGALFAGQTAGGPSEVHCRLYTQESPHWTYTLRPKCKVLGIAIGAFPATAKNLRNEDLDGFGNIVIATTDGDLTFLSGTGRERRILGLAGEFISMVASHEWVFVVHRAGSTTIDGSQNLSYTLINFEDFSVRQRDFLPIPKGHILKWIGVTEEGAPAMYDSTGRIHLLAKFRIPHHASWTLVLDTKLLERTLGDNEAYWPIAIHGSTFMSLITKGSQYPVFPIPLLVEFPIEMPFRAEQKKEKPEHKTNEQLEREILMLEIMRDSLDDELTNEEISKTEQSLDKGLVLLIQSACQTSNVPRALEFAKLIHNPKFLDAVGKMSEFYRLPGLTEAVGTLKRIREETEDRLILARDKRKQWTTPDPLPRLLSTATDSGSSRPKPFQDFGPPPAVSRPGLAPAVPVKETTRYTANASIELPPTPAEFSSNSPPENKRKRDEVEDIPSSLDFVPPPPKQKINPFARKVGQENGRNPFGRKTDIKTLQKSESFFEKVEAEEVAPKAKRSSGLKPKDKKESGPRQTTLFGMMSSAPRPTATPKSRLATVEADVPDNTMTDLGETQVETQPDLPEEWEETQPVEASSLEETQPVTP